MTREIQSQLLGEFYAEKKNTMKLKGEDYANEDVLSNFKTAGANIGISAEQQCLSLIATKVARLGNLLSGKTPNNESISDSILDLSNYTDLLYCLVNEQITDKVESIAKQRKDKFNEYLVNEIAKLSKAMGGKKNTNPECECTEIPKEYKPTYEVKTNRWENVKPQQKSLLKEMMKQDEKDGLYEAKTKHWENVEPFNPPSSGLRPMNEYGITDQIKWADIPEKHNESQPLTLEECFETYRDVFIKTKPIKEEDIFYKGGEPIKEPYEPKVLDYNKYSKDEDGYFRK